MKAPLPTEGGGRGKGAVFSSWPRSVIFIQERRNGLDNLID